MKKFVYLRPPIVVKALASQLEVSPYRLMYDLCGMNVFVRINQCIETEVARVLCARYGFTLFIGEKK
jgi:hypothetical protein